MKPIACALAFSTLLMAPLAAIGSALTVRLADTDFVMEVVADPDSRRQGLMGRENLPFGTGMLFDFPDGTRCLWLLMAG